MGALRKRKNEVDISHLKNRQVFAHHTTECLSLMYHGMDEVVSSHTASSSSADLAICIALPVSYKIL